MKTNNSRYVLPIAIAGILAVALVVGYSVTNVVPPDNGRGLPTVLQSTAVPMLVRLEDYNNVLPTVTTFPALASHIDVRWDQIAPTGTPGTPQWDWSKIKTPIARVTSQVVRLNNGTLVPRPLWISIPLIFSQSASAGVCDNYVPAWVAAGAANYNVNGQPVPRYDSLALKLAYSQTIQALGVQYGNDPTIAGFIVGGGYNNEEQFTSSWCHVPAATPTPGGPTMTPFPITAAEMGDWTLNSIRAFHQYLSNKPVFVNIAAVEENITRCDVVNELNSYGSSNNIGIGFNGMGPDAPGFIRYPSGIYGDEECGSLEVVKDNMGTIPSKMEPAIANPSSIQYSYWAWLLALTNRVSYIDAQDEWFCNASGCPTPIVDELNDIEASPNNFPVPFGWWIEQQYNKTIADSRHLWIAFRDTEFPENGGYCQGYCSGWEGNFEHGLQFGIGLTTHLCSPNAASTPYPSGALSCWNYGLPDANNNPYSRHARQMDGSSIVIDVDPNYPQGIMTNVTARIAYVDSDPTDFLFTYNDGTTSVSKTIDRVGSGLWKWATFSGLTIDNTKSIRIQYYGEVTKPILHMIWLDVVLSVLNTATPTSTVCPLCTNTPTATNTPTSIATRNRPTTTATPVSPDAVYISEVFTANSFSADDWNIDGKLDRADGYFEVYNNSGATVNLFQYRLHETGSNWSYRIPKEPDAILVNGARYVVFGSIPSSGIIELRSPINTIINTRTYTDTGSSLSSNWTGASLYVGKPSPGLASNYWSTHPTPTPFITPTPTPTLVATNTPTPTPTGPTATPTRTPTITPTFTKTPTLTPTPTLCPLCTPTPTPTFTKTYTPTPTPTPTPISANWTPPSPITINPGTAAYARWQPMAAYDSINDRYLLVWQDKRNDTNANCGPWSIGYSGTCDPLSSNGDIYGRLVSADGTSLGSDFVIASEPTGQKLDAQWPTVAFDPYRGDYLVTWQQIDPLAYTAAWNTYSYCYNIMARRVSSSGNVGQTITISSAVDCQWVPQITIDVSVNPAMFLIMWHDHRYRFGMGREFDTDKEIFGQWIVGGTPSLTLQGSNFLVSTTGGAQTPVPRNQQYSTTTTRNNISYSCWSDDRDSVVSGSEPFGIWCKKLTTGGYNNVPYKITDITGVQEKPRIAYARDDETQFIVWQSYPIPPGTTSIQGVVLNSLSTPVAPVFDISVGTASYPLPAIACTVNGICGITWGGSGGLKLVRYDSYGNYISGPHTLVSSTVDDARIIRGTTSTSCQRLSVIWAKNGYLFMSTWCDA